MSKELIKEAYEYADAEQAIYLSGQKGEKPDERAASNSELFAELAARIASLEAELDAASESATSMTRWGAEQRDRADAAEAERDGANAIIERVQGEVDAVGGYAILRTSDIAQALSQSPADALAGVKAEAAATALEEQQQRFREYTLNHASPEALFDHIMQLLSRDAAAIRSEVK